MSCQQQQLLHQYRDQVLVTTSAFNPSSALLTLYRMVMPIGTPFLKEKINN